jgi:outer membrane beta-barrel protein
MTTDSSNGQEQMTKNWLAVRCVALALAAGLATAGTLGFSSTVEAQEVQITGPLAGAPAVRHMRLYRVNRFNLVPGIGYTLQDEFARSLFLGLEANYHFLEWLGVGIWGGYAVGQIDTDLTTQIDTFAQVTDRNRLSVPSAGGFNQQIGRILWGVSAHLIFIPLRGKLSLFQAVFVDTDLYVIAGVALFGLEERASTVVDGARLADCDTADLGMTRPRCLASQTARAGRVTPAPMLGVGLSLYANSWFGVALEWRAFPFSWNPSGTDEAGSPRGNFPDGRNDGTDSRTTFNHMFNVGVIFNLPPEQSGSE